jgi:SAM-dependent methyltransferase
VSAGDARLDGRVDNLLYRHPELYEEVYPEPADGTVAMVRRMMTRFLPGPARSLLDVGCGTGRDLAGLAGECGEGWGVDASAEMIAYARSVRPQLHLQVGDMRDVRLGRTFDVVTCLGSVLMYALTNRDLDRALATFRAHAHRDTLLVLDVNNAGGFLQGGFFRLRYEEEVPVGDVCWTARYVNRFDVRHQVWIRQRTWIRPGLPEAEDYCEYRLLFPAELEDRLERQGWAVVGMFDNLRLRPSDFSGRRLYVAALSRAGAG